MKTLKNIYSLIERLENRDGFLLNEITIKDKWQKESNKWQGKLDAETFEYLCGLDPTTNPNKVGRYANWILAKYNPNADLDRLKVCLEWYADGVKRGVINRLGISNDINSYKSYDEFISAMNGVMHSDDSDMSNSEYNNRQKLEGQFEILGSNSMFDIIACKTFAAERYFGSGTEWCTVANESYFNSYMKQGQLYIIYPKNGNEELKLQFHFETDSYADKYDEVYEDPLECIEETIGYENIIKELCQICKVAFPEYQSTFMTVEECLPIALQRLANGENPSDVFDMVYDFREGFAVVKLCKKWNFINQEGHLISNQWYDWVMDFREGFAMVELNGKRNFINQEGEIAFDQWYDYVDSFKNGFAAVQSDGKWSFINQEGEIAFDQWYDYVDSFKNGFAEVKLNGKYNFINQEGHLISDQWYDWVWGFYKGFAGVQLDGKKYKLDTSGRLHNMNENKEYKTNKIKQKISLTESDLHRMIKESVKQVLNEITIKDKWQKESNKWNGKFDSETFEYLCGLDPTTNPNKVGKYANWILAKYNPNADFDRLKVCLEWYADGIKRGVINRLGINNDINVYKSYDEFIAAMNDVMRSDDSTMSNSEYNNRQKLEGQFEILGSNSMFDIIACKTFAAERYFGSGTEWCTVANERYFNSYMKDGQLYIIYPKNGNEELKMQFHFETDSYADKYDKVYYEPYECIVYTIKDEKIQSELIELCKNTFTEYQSKFMSFDEALTHLPELLEKGYSLNDIFNEVGNFKEDVAIVELQGKFNFINKKREIVFNTWFDDAYSFFNGVAMVYLSEYGWNLIDHNGQPIFKQWYDSINNFGNGFGFYQVNLNGRYNLISKDDEYLSPRWFKEIRFDFAQGIAIGSIGDDLWYKININDYI